MAGHSRSKNGVASLAYVPAIHALLSAFKTWMPATSAGMTSTELDVGELDDLGPLFCFVSEEFAEFGRRHGRRRVTTTRTSLPCSQGAIHARLVAKVRAA